MPSNYTSLTVTWYDQSDAYVTTDNITSDVKSIPLFTDTGTGEVNQATIIVRSLRGLYNTTGSTIFAEFDRIRIQCTDLGGNTYDRYFEIINIIPSQAKREGTLLTLECLGIEYHAQQIHMAKPFWFEDSFEVGKVVGDIYEENRGSEQPVLTKFDTAFTEGNGFGSALPEFNANNWEFGLNEDSCYNRWMDLLEGAGAAVAAGGALTFYELNFLTTGVNAMDFKLRKSGDNSTIITLQNAVATGVKVGEQEGMLTNPTGTNLMAWGSPEHGTLPVANSKYDSQIIQFTFRPEWENAVDYATDAKVKVTPATAVAPKHYKALSDHTSSVGNKPPSASWVQIDMAEEFGNTLQYSPWTDGKATLWGNNGCDPERTTFTTAGWCDINLVINESEFFRTWADAIATSNADLNALAQTTNDGYGYGAKGGTASSASLPRGFRVLVNTNSPTGLLANFANMVVEVKILNSDMGLFYDKLYDFTTANTKVQVAVIHEGKVYTDTITAGPTHSWTSLSTADYANDCFHAYTTLPAEFDGIDLINGITRSEVTDSTNRPDITKAGGTFTENQESAVKFIATSSDILRTAFEGNASPTSTYYTNAIGLNLRFPFPNNNFNGITEDIGDLYGGGINGNREPATLDIQNMNFTSGGLQGFNHGAESQDYGQINAVAFWLHYSQTIGGVEANDEHRFRAWFIDSADNVVYQDFVVRFSNNWEDIRLPIGSFRIYKGRKPVYGFSAAIAAFFPPKELEVINIFEWRNIKIFGIQLQSQYDKFGRFNPAAAAVDEAGNSVTWTNLLGATRTLSLDGFRFIKPLLVTSGQNTTRNLEPDFLQLPNITVYDQLLNAAKSHLEIEKFKHKEFNVESSGDEIFDIPFGDAFHLENTDIVSENERDETSEGANDGDEGTIKLVNKRTEYSITKPVGGKGGLRRKLNGSKVFI